MKIVIDTNIVFSALVSSNSTIAELIIGSGSKIHFYTSEYLQTELSDHHAKLKKASRLSDQEIETAKFKLFKYVDFVTLGIIPEKYWLRAEKLVLEIDPDDIPFVALSLYLRSYLWTGDKVLYEGLRNKGFDKVVSTNDLKTLLIGSR